MEGYCMCENSQLVTSERAQCSVHVAYITVHEMIYKSHLKPSVPFFNIQVYSK